METNKNLGKLIISDETISKTAGIATLECEGVFGMVADAKIKSGVLELLKKENINKGIIVRKDEENDELHIDAHIIAVYGVNVVEVAKGVQKRIVDDLSLMFDLRVDSVNVFVREVRTKKEEKEVAVGE